MPCLKQGLKDLKKHVFSLNKHTMFDKENFHMLQLAFIMEFHLKISAVRRDLASVNYRSETPNFLDVNAQKIVLTQYKTAKKYGRKEFQLTRECWKLFSWLRTQHRLRGITDGHLLRNRYWKPLTR